MEVSHYTESSPVSREENMCFFETWKLERPPLEVVSRRRHKQLPVSVKFVWYVQN